MDDHLELHDAARMPVGARPVVPHPPPLQGISHSMGTLIETSYSIPKRQLK